MKPIYLLAIDELPPDVIGLVVRTDEHGIAHGEIRLPRWQELPAAYDGPHRMGTAIALADAYARDYGYRAIAIDIESSQMWDDAWGTLRTGFEDDL